MRIEVFPRRTLFGKRWFIRMRANNHEIIPESNGYHNLGDAWSTANLIRKDSFDAVIEKVKK